MSAFRKKTPDESQVVFEHRSGDPEGLYRIGGRLDVHSASDIWEQALNEARSESADPMVLQAKSLEYCDGAGAALLIEMRCVRHTDGRELEFRGLDDRMQRMVDEIDFEALESERDLPEDEDTHAIEDLGEAASKVWNDLREMITFFGNVIHSLFRSMLHPFSVRWRDTWYVVENAGANTLPIVLLVAFIIGLVMAFQAAMLLREYGADIFVADLIVLSMTRELAPLMTAIILAGRSGSAFAAEIGTMRINEEVDALSTMGIDPVRFLVVPRVLAATFVTPLLTLYANLIGILGGACVLVSLGHPLESYYNRVIYVATSVHLLSGLAKSVVFGFLVAWVGCLRGLQTRTGASGVGKSTTRAVVSAIVLIAIFDAIFSIMYYLLGI